MHGLGVPHHSERAGARLGSGHSVACFPAGPRRTCRPWPVGSGAPGRTGGRRCAAASPVGSAARPPARPRSARRRPPAPQSRRGLPRRRPADGRPGPPVPARRPGPGPGPHQRPDLRRRRLDRRPQPARPPPPPSSRRRNAVNLFLGPLGTGPAPGCPAGRRRRSRCATRAGAAPTRRAPPVGRPTARRRPAARWRGRSSTTAVIASTAANLQRTVAVGEQQDQRGDRRRAPPRSRTGRSVAGGCASPPETTGEGMAVQPTEMWAMGTVPGQKCPGRRGRPRASWPGAGRVATATGYRSTGGERARRRRRPGRAWPVPVFSAVLVCGPPASAWTNGPNVMLVVLSRPGWQNGRCGHSGRAGQHGGRAAALGGEVGERLQPVLVGERLGHRERVLVRRRRRRAEGQAVLGRPAALSALTVALMSPRRGRVRVLAVGLLVEELRQRRRVLGEDLDLALLQRRLVDLAVADLSAPWPGSRPRSGRSCTARPGSGSRRSWPRRPRSCRCRRRCRLVRPLAVANSSAASCGVLRSTSTALFRASSFGWSSAAATLSTAAMSAGFAALVLTAGDDVVRVLQVLVVGEQHQLCHRPPGRSRRRPRPGGRCLGARGAGVPQAVRRRRTRRGPTRGSSSAV